MNSNVEDLALFFVAAWFPLTLLGVVALWSLCGHFKKTTDEFKNITIELKRLRGNRFD